MRVFDAKIVRVDCIDKLINAVLTWYESVIIYIALLQEESPTRWRLDNTKTEPLNRLEFDVLYVKLFEWTRTGEGWRNL